ncbi:hypothetical protein [Dysgonomonas termitidis]|uniref:Major capsid protein n=1 Tax=Dysgonomonas termitidis TaxID=1516126 RepID=A0ABV9KR94_9BACT
MHIRLKDTGAVLDMKPNTKLSVTLNNPMLKEQASMSLPLTLPRTPTNVRSLGDVDITSLYKYKRTRDALVEAGVWQKQGLLRIGSGSREIEGAVYLDESPMYARMKETEMSQAFDITRPASDFHVSGTFTSDLDMMIKYMELVMVGNIEDDFYLFPVATDHFDQDITNSEGTTNYTFYQVLNEQYSALYPVAGDMDTDMNGKPYFKLCGRIPRKYYEGSKFIDAPKGYAISPFLKQSYVLRRIFAYFGYELRESIFDTDPEMKKIAVLNNTADSIVHSQLKYSQLVPSVKISDYLQSARTDYGCEFFISPDYKYVDVKFWNDILDNKDYIPLDDKISDIPEINLSDSKMIKLTNNRSIEYSDVSFDTLEKFEANKGPLINTPYPPVSGPEGYYFMQEVGQIWQKSVNEAGQTEWKYDSQYLFDEYKDKEDSVNDDYDTRDSKREHIAFLTVFVRYFRIDTMLHIGTNYYMLYIGKRRHMNTTLKALNGAGTDDDKVVESNKDTMKCPIMTAFYRGRSSNYEAQYAYKCVYGNIHGYSMADEGLPYPGGFDLIFGGTNGLYQKFWTKYAAVIRDSFNEVKLPLRLGIQDVMNFRFDNIYMFDNQPLLPEKLAFSIDRDDKVMVSEAVFRTIKLYLDS